MYCTVDDLRDQSSEEFLIRCTDDAGVGAIDQTVVEKKIADAQTVSIHAPARGATPLALPTPL